MKIISSLPEALINELLSVWCNVVEIAKLNIVISNKKDILNFHAQITNDRFSVEGIQSKNDSHLHWCDMKGLRLRNVIITRRLINWPYLHTLPTSTINTIKCTFSSPKHNAYFIYLDMVIMFINRCPLLTSLSLKDSWNFSDLARINSEIWSRLRSFECNSSRVESNFTVFLASNCHNLTNLQYTSSSEENESEFIKLLANNPLRRLHHEVVFNGEFSDKVLHTLCNHATYLTHVSLHCCGHITFRATANLITTCKCLVELNMNCDSLEMEMYTGDCSLYYSREHKELSLYDYKTQVYDNINDNVSLLFEWITDLSVIRFRGCAHLTSMQLFETIAKHNKAPKYPLSLDNGDDFTAENVRHLFPSNVVELFDN